MAKNFSSSVLQGKKADRNNSTSASATGFGMGAANPDLCPDDCYTQHYICFLCCYVSMERGGMTSSSQQEKLLLEKGHSLPDSTAQPMAAH